MPSAPSNIHPFPEIHSIIPLRTFAWDRPAYNPSLPAEFEIALLNQNLAPVTVELSSSVEETFTWSLQTDSPKPRPATAQVAGNVDFTVSVADAPWLAVSAMQGTAPTTLTFMPNLSGLSPGTYNAAVTITPAIAQGSLAPIMIDFTVTVTAGMSRKTSIGTSQASRAARVVAATAPISASPASIAWNWQLGMPASAATVDVEASEPFLVDLTIPG